MSSASEDNRSSGCYREFVIIGNGKQNENALVNISYLIVIDLSIK